MQQWQHIQHIISADKAMELELNPFDGLSFCFFVDWCFMFSFLIYLPPFCIGVGVGTCFPTLQSRASSWLPVGQ